MKRFRFGPEALLSLRRHTLRGLEAALAGLEARRAEAVQKSRELEERSLAARESIGAGGLLRGADLQRAAAASETMHLQARELNRFAMGLEREAAAALRKVAGARREVETLEKLRERSLAEWRRGEQREEEGLAAELYLARLARRDNQ